VPLIFVLSRFTAEIIATGMPAAIEPVDGPRRSKERSVDGLFRALIRSRRLPFPRGPGDRSRAGLLCQNQTGASAGPMVMTGFHKSSPSTPCSPNVIYSQSQSLWDDGHDPHVARIDNDYFAVVNKIQKTQPLRFDLHQYVRHRHKPEQGRAEPLIPRPGRNRHC
jgi:hypothetical protein